VNCLCVLGVSGQGSELSMCVRGKQASEVNCLCVLGVSGQGSELSMCVRGIGPGK
jgi:hypothetical protein